MALIWADNFAMYGTVGNMINGVYGSTQNTTLITSPTDSYIRCSGGSTFSNPNILYPLSGAKTEVGQAFFLYLESLPADNTMNTKFGGYFTNSGELIYFRALPTGQIQIVYNNVSLGVTSTPVLTANSDIHIETKVKISATEGRIELRVRGKTVFLLEDINTGTTAITRLGHHNAASSIGAASVYRIRHWCMWDTSGAVNNDFLGQVMVYWNQPISTIEAGGWVSSANAEVHETLDKPRMANQLTSSGSIVNNDTVRIDNTYYRWTSGSVAAGAGTSANPWLVALGIDSPASLQNMYSAINGTGTPGGTYSPTLVPHPLVEAFGIISNAFCVIPKVEGTTTMSFSETGAALAWTSTTTFLYQVWDPIQMTCGYISAVKAYGDIDFTGNPSDGDTVTLGGQTFTFKTSVVDPTDVLIGVDVLATTANLSSSLSAKGTLVTTTGYSSSATYVEARSAGASGNSITMAAASAVITVSGATLTGGVDVTYPTPFELGLTPLPDDVTSIRAVIPVVRAAKIDGGDGNIQVSFGTLDTNFDDGPDTPITNAFTYWGNVTDPFISEINPDTGTPWTPGEFNLGARVRVNRTK